MNNREEKKQQADALDKLEKQTDWDILFDFTNSSHFTF